MHAPHAPGGGTNTSTATRVPAGSGACTQARAGGLLLPQYDIELSRQHHNL